ncbi:hypothetical protein Pelo_13810 [Pelomyxa schiedti]|nr:hypothetical protein Pelo_13810 [Pelomyxa schiedti]
MIIDFIEANLPICVKICQFVPKRNHFTLSFELAGTQLDKLIELSIDGRRYSFVEKLPEPIPVTFIVDPPDEGDINLLQEVGPDFFGTYDKFMTRKSRKTEKSTNTTQTTLPSAQLQVTTKPKTKPQIIMEGRMSKVQFTWENNTMDILRVYTPYTGHPEAVDFWDTACTKYTRVSASATILIGDFNIPLSKHQHPSFERSSTLRQTAHQAMQKWEVHPVDSKSPTHIQNGTCYTLDHAAVTTLKDISSQLTTWESSALDHYLILLMVSPKPKTVWNRNRPPRWTFENPAYKLHLTKLLPDALPDHPVACWKADKCLLIQAAWQTMNNKNNTQQDTLSLLFKLQKASALEALRIIKSNKEVADLFDYYPPSPNQIHEAIAWVKTQLNIKIPKKRHTPFLEIPTKSTVYVQMLDPITNNLTCNSKRKDEITKDFWAPLLGPISSNEEARKALLSNYNKKLNPIPHLTKTDIEATILSCKSRSAPGPDGVTFAAWKALPKLSASILCNMFYWLSEHLAPDHFNDSLFFAFPKVERTTRIDESRPISLPNTDNRIITKAMSYILNPLIAQLCHPNQNGFFEGRLIDDNIMAVSNTYYVLKHTIIHILEHIGMSQTWTLLMKLHDSPVKPKVLAYADDICTI